MPPACRVDSTVRSGATSSQGLCTGSRPERTCVGCRSRDEQSALLRVVARPEETDTTRWRIIRDERRREQGRGAYVHHDPRCLQFAITRRGFTRALRLPAGSQVDLSEIEDLLQRST